MEFAHIPTAHPCCSADFIFSPFIYNGIMLLSLESTSTDFSIHSWSFRLVNTFTQAFTHFFTRKGIYSRFSISPHVSLFTKLCLCIFQILTIGLCLVRADSGEALPSPERSIDDSDFAKTANYIMKTAMKLPPHILPTLEELDTKDRRHGIDNQV